MTLTLERPFADTATAAVTCDNVASATEFSVSGDQNMRLSDRSFVSIHLNAGDRWAVRSDEPRTNGVRLEITVTPEAVPDDGKPETAGMQSTPSSTVEAQFANEGGRVRFANLEPMAGIDYTGAAIDLAGAIEWTCDPV